MKRLQVSTARREQFVDITSAVAAAVAEAGAADGWALAYCPHTTAGITINENADPDVVRDLLAALERMVPREAGYSHREGNADAHVKASLMGSSATVPVTGAALALGRWQGIYLCEFDGPRTRNVFVDVRAC
ncbi:MAG: secondary thiamine-phosphate synthase enzyme YjbQ [Actinomycetota bacterium]|nr:secondary thiamine-phosphate synthase enzyme YjbQ [Actinomycetota bacterium]